MVSSPSSPCPFSLTVGEKGSNGQFFPSPRDAVARERGAGVRGSQMASKAGGFRADFSVTSFLQGRGHYPSELSVGTPSSQKVNRAPTERPS